MRNLLNEFFNSQNDANLVLDATEQENLEVMFQKWFELKFQQYIIRVSEEYESWLRDFDYESVGENKEDDVRIEKLNKCFKEINFIE